MAGSDAEKPLIVPFSAMKAKYDAHWNDSGLLKKFLAKIEKGVEEAAKRGLRFAEITFDHRDFKEIPFTPVESQLIRKERPDGDFTEQDADKSKKQWMPPLSSAIEIGTH